MVSGFLGLALNFLFVLHGIMDSKRTCPVVYTTQGESVHLIIYPPVHPSIYPSIRLFVSSERL